MNDQGLEDMEEEVTETTPSITNSDSFDEKVTRVRRNSSCLYFSHLDAKFKFLPEDSDAPLYHGSKMTVGEIFWFFLNLVERFKLENVCHADAFFCKRVVARVWGRNLRFHENLNKIAS